MFGFGRKAYEEIDPATLVEWKRDRPSLTIIDVREAWEYAGGHVPGAKNLPLGELSDTIDQVPDGAVIVCASGNRSGQACNWLTSQGKRDIANLAGGTQGWAMHGYDLD